MCGIAGIVKFYSKENQQTTVKTMLDAISHRGPDSRGVFIWDNLALGHVRLSIIDLNEGADQPMHSKDGELTIVFNGEIYNYKALQKKLDRYFSQISPGSSIFWTFLA